jgi:antitoxin ParD1/3/4
MTIFESYIPRVKMMKLITLYLPEPYLEALDELVTKRYYPHRAEAIRVAIRDLVSMELWGREKNAKDS